MRKTSTYARKRRSAPDKCRANPLSSLALISMAQTFRPGELIEQHNVTRIALERLRNGNGSIQDFDRVGMALNMGLVLAEGIHASLVTTMTKAQAAMVRMQDRYRRGLALAFDSQGLSDVPTAIDAYEDIADMQSALQITAAVREACRRCTSGKTLDIAWAQGAAS